MRDLGAIPKSNQPPSVFKKAQPELMPASISPVVFLTSRMRFSSLRMMVSISCIVSSLISQILLTYKNTDYFRVTPRFFAVCNGLQPYALARSGRVRGTFPLYSKTPETHKVCRGLFRSINREFIRLTCKVPCLYRVTINSTINLRVKFSFSNFAV